MRLSEAILLGDVLKTRDDMTFLSRDNSCGCALGGAFLAVGGQRNAANGDSVIRGLEAIWPWLTIEIRHQIGFMYLSHESIERIAEYVRSVEPSEPPVQEPSQVEVRQESTVSHG